jgi:hypothetical protein
MLVSVLLVGFKLNAPTRLLRVIQRRKELQTALALLQPQLEEVDRAVWLEDVDHDKERRQERIAAMNSMSAAAASYTALENQGIDEGMGMFAVFESTATPAQQVKHCASIDRCETKLDEKSGLLLGRSESEVRASPEEIVAYTLNFFGSRIHQSLADPTSVRQICLQNVHGCHTICFNRAKAAGISHRTFLFSIVAKKLTAEPAAYAVVVFPIPSHAQIGPKDEAGAIRAETRRNFMITEVAPGVSRVNYCVSLDLKGWIP